MNEQSGSGQSVGGDVGKILQVTEDLDNARSELQAALVNYGLDLDEVAREILAAVDAIDRARRILREGR